ncbi:MAG: hypothetical protein OFPI_06270 [Osedax symbiont Rs2]|nr:MAG: hypothetical protein OFPI_06270 [Osedax symbiont Rs2]
MFAAGREGCLVHLGQQRTLDHIDSLPVLDLALGLFETYSSNYPLVTAF